MKELMFFKGIIKSIQTKTLEAVNFHGDSSTNTVYTDYISLKKFKTFLAVLWDDVNNTTEVQNSPVQNGWICKLSCFILTENLPVISVRIAKEEESKNKREESILFSIHRVRSIVRRFIVSMPALKSFLILTTGEQYYNRWKLWEASRSA